MWESERKIATLRYFERSRTLAQTQTRTRRGGSELSVHMTALCVKGMGLGLLIQGNGFQLCQSGEGCVTATRDRQGIGRLSEDKIHNTYAHMRQHTAASLRLCLTD